MFYKETFNWGGNEPIINSCYPLYIIHCGRGCVELDKTKGEVSRIVLNMSWLHWGLVDEMEYG